MATIEEAIAKARQSNANVELRQYSSVSGEAVFRLPNSAEASAFRKRTFDKDAGTRADALENLVRTCLVFPDVETFNALINKRPFLVDTWGDKLVDAAGAEEQVTEKKL
jgi:hypothetical protein